jgi:hypothetical protein
MISAVPLSLIDPRWLLGLQRGFLRLGAKPTLASADSFQLSQMNLPAAVNASGLTKSYLKKCSSSLSFLEPAATPSMKGFQNYKLLLPSISRRLLQRASSGWFTV